MTKRQKLIKYLENQRDIEIQMLSDVKNYMDVDDRRCSKFKRRFIEKIDLIEYNLMSIK